MTPEAIIRKMEDAGFTLRLDQGDLIVSPPGKLTDPQRQFLKAHKPEIVAALREREAVLKSSQSGHDHPAANDDWVTIHVPDLALSSGQHIACDMTVPEANVPALRAVLRFTLVGDEGGGSVLGEPGKTAEELKAVLHDKYGARLAPVNGQAGFHTGGKNR